MATFNSLGVDIPTTIDARVQTVTIDRGGQNEEREIVVLGDHTSSLALATITNAAPVSTEFGLVVRQVGYSTGPIAISSIAGVTKIGPSDTNWASSAGFHFNSSGELTIAGTLSASTTVNVSSVAGRVTTAPNDTNWASSAGFHFDSSGALQTKDASTGPFAISSIAGQTRVAPTDTNWASSAGFHFDGAGALTVSVSAPSTGPVAISSIAGLTRVGPNDTNFASSAGFHFDSSGALQIKDVAGSTGPIAISTIGGRVTVAPSDTNFASSAGFHFTSSGELQVAGTFAASTTVNVSSLAGRVTVAPSDTNWASSAGFHFNSSGDLKVDATVSVTGSSDVRINNVTVSTLVQNSSAYLAVRLTDGSSFLPLTADYTDGSTASTLVAPSLTYNNGSNATMRMVGITQPLPIQVTDSSNAGVKPGDSANNAIRVNVVAGAAGGSTIVTVSTIQGEVRIAPASTAWASSAGFHFNSSGDLKVDASLTTSTTVNVSSLAGRVTVAPSDTNWASSAGFHFDSSGALQIKDTTLPSTGPFAISSIAGVTKVGPSDTNWAFSAGFHFTSSGELSVAASFTGSTDVRISGVAVSTFAQNSSAYLAVRLTDGSSFITPGADYTDGSTVSTLLGPGLTYNNSSNNTMRLVGITQPLPIQVTDSSNAGVKPGDSANNAIRVNVVAGAAGGSTIVTVSTIQGVVRTTPSDTNWASSAGFHFDAFGSLNVAPSYSTEVGIHSVSVSSGGTPAIVGDLVNNAIRVNVVAGAAGGSTLMSLNGVVVSTSVQNSSAYIAVRVTDGSSYLVPLTEYTDGSTVSTLVGPALMFNNSSNDTMRMVGSSTPLPVLATLSTTVLSTAAPSSNSTAVVTRVVIDAILTQASVNAFGGGGAGSTVYAIQSSVANYRAYVTAYSITSTVTTSRQIAFYSSNTVVWPLVLQAPTSGVTGANLAVAPNGYLFRNYNPGEAMSLRTNGSSESGWVVAISYYLST